ncbi:MAG: hypothetical protein R3307_07365 [Anaerolineales bacterium]|nr:hypothetical protein [Anaerolineales bacterium]
MKALYFLLVALLIASCGPSAEQMTATNVAAQAQTKTAAPTFTPTKTNTPLPTNTPEPTPVPTQTSSCGEDQNVDISQGSYDCEEYISPDEIFSCQLSEIPALGISSMPGYMLVADFTIGSGWDGGGLYARTFSNSSFYIEYFSNSNLTEDIQALLKDPSTTEQGLERILDELLLPARNSLHSIKDKGYDPDKGLIVALLHQEVENDYTVYTTEVTVISPGADYFYFTTVENSVIPLGSNTDPDSVSFDLSSIQLPYLYNSCKLRR